MLNRHQCVGIVTVLMLGAIPAIGDIAANRGLVEETRTQLTDSPNRVKRDPAYHGQGRSIGGPLRCLSRSESSRGLRFRPERRSSRFSGSACFPVRHPMRCSLNGNFRELEPARRVVRQVEGLRRGA